MTFFKIVGLKVKVNSLLINNRILYSQAYIHKKSTITSKLFRNGSPKRCMRHEKQKPPVQWLVSESPPCRLSGHPNQKSTLSNQTIVQTLSDMKNPRLTVSSVSGLLGVTPARPHAVRTLLLTSSVDAREGLHQQTRRFIQDHGVSAAYCTVSPISCCCCFYCFELRSV